MTPLVIVRPQPGSDSTAAAARACGLDAIVMPLFAVDPVDWKAPDPGDFDGLLLTSANAIRHGGEQLEQLLELPAHCVGDATAKAARDRGFAIASVGKDDVDSLLAEVAAGCRLLHLCGVHRREARGPLQSIEPVPVYAARELAPPPDKFEQIRGAVVAIHSPRAAARLSQLAHEARLERETIAIAAISEAAATAAGEAWGRVEIAAEPTDRALLALAAQLCNNPR